MTGPGPSSEQPPSMTPPSEPASNWSAAPAAPPPAAVPGAAGYVYADVPNRIIAYIIDAIILGVIGFIAAAILGAVGLNAVTIDLNNPTAPVQYNFVAGIVQAIVSTAVSGAYFIYTWTSMRASPGQKVLGMQVGNAGDGATLTQEQAIKRWIALGAPFGLASALNPMPGLGLLIGLAALAWFIALLVTTAQSPTKQGLHDKYAGSVVVKAARSVG